MNRFERLGRWCARHRRPVVVSWLALVALSIPLALQAPDDASVSERVRADVREMASAFPLYPAPVVTAS